MVAVELTVAPFAGRPGGEVFRREGVALFIDARPAIYLLKEDGTRERLVARHLVESTVWVGLAGTRLAAPHLVGDDLVVHLGAKVLSYRGYCDCPLSFGVVGDTLFLSRTESPLGDDRDWVYLRHGRWHHGDPGRYLQEGCGEIMIAPVGFALEDLPFLGLGRRKRRDRPSVLAG